MANPVYDQVLMETTIKVFDFEATDRNPQIAKILQIGMVDVVDGSLAGSEWNVLVNPGPEITELSDFVINEVGITLDMIEGKPLITQRIPEMANRIGKNLVAGHNIKGYDLPLLRHENNEDHPIQNNFYVDTLILARKLKLTENNKLKTLAAHYKIEFDESNLHDALVDCRLTAMVMLEQLKALKSKDVHTFGDYLEYVSG